MIQVAIAIAEQFRVLEVPVLLAVGDEDAPGLESNLMLKRAIPGAGLWIHPHTGHAINLDEPAAFSAAVTTFVAEVERSERHHRLAAPQPRPAPATARDRARTGERHGVNVWVRRRCQQPDTAADGDREHGHGGGSRPSPGPGSSVRGAPTLVALPLPLRTLAAASPHLHGEAIGASRPALELRR